MSKHIESIVTRMPVRDADRSPSIESRPAPATPPRPLTPVSELPDLAPEARVAELRLRVSSGVYARGDVVEQVARRIVLGGTIRG